MKCPECKSENTEIHVPYIAEKVYYFKDGKLCQFDEAEDNWIEPSGTMDGHCNECGEAWEIGEGEWMEMVKQRDGE